MMTGNKAKVETKQPHLLEELLGNNTRTDITIKHPKVRVVSTEYTCGCSGLLIATHPRPQQQYGNHCNHVVYTLPAQR